MRLMHRVAEARSEIHTLLEKRSAIPALDSHATSRLEALIEELEYLASALDSWEQTLPECFCSQEVKTADLDPQDPRTAIMASQDIFDSILLYKSLSPAIAYNHLRCLRIFVIQGLRDCRISLDRYPASDCSETIEVATMTDICRSTLQFLAREYDCGTALFSNEALGGMRGLVAFWPLKAVISASELTKPLASKSHLKFLNKVLAHIYQKNGVPQAKNFVMVED